MNPAGVVLGGWGRRVEFEASRETQEPVSDDITKTRAWDVAQLFKGLAQSLEAQVYKAQAAHAGSPEPEMQRGPGADPTH